MRNLETTEMSFSFMSENFKRKLSVIELQDFFPHFIENKSCIKSHFKLLELQSRGDCQKMETTLGKFEI